MDKNTNQSININTIEPEYADSVILFDRRNERNTRQSVSVEKLDLNSAQKKFFSSYNMRKCQTLISWVHSNSKQPREINVLSELSAEIPQNAIK